MTDTRKSTAEPEAQPCKERTETHQSQALGSLGLLGGTERVGIRTIVFGLRQPPPGVRSYSQSIAGLTPHSGPPPF